MSKRLYVGNLPYSADRESLRGLFAEYGAVTDVHVASDRETGRSRGFGFVSFETDDEAKAAAQALNGHSLDGRALVVNVARERGAGPPPGPRRDTGPRRDAGPRSGPPPVAAGPGPADLGADEETRRLRVRAPRTKKKPQREKERRHRTRALEEDEGRRGGNWRQWLDDADDIDSGEGDKEIGRGEDDAEAGAREPEERGDED